MPVLLIDSFQPGEGKTTLATAIGQRLSSQGRRLSFLRFYESPNKAEALTDATFLAQAFNLDPSRQIIHPIDLPADTPLRDRLKEAMSTDDTEETVRIIEGNGNLLRSPQSLEALKFALDQTKAKIIVVSRYYEILAPEELLQIATTLDGLLVGAVITGVPDFRQERVRSDYSDGLKKVGSHLLGAIPYSRSLAGVTAGEIARQLEGEIIGPPESQQVLISNLLIASMSLDEIATYLKSQTGAAIVVSAERLDLQLNSLDSPLSCLILTGDGEPTQYVTARCEDQGVPIVLVPQDTISTMERLGNIFAQARFRQPAKLGALNQACKDGLDAASIVAALS